MVMKYVKAVQLRIKHGLVVVSAVALVACGGATNPTKDSVMAEPAPQVIETTGFLPVDQFDKEGNKLPYEPRPNPYAAQESRVKKQSVALYIEARRAFKASKFDQAKATLEKLAAEDASLSGPYVMLGDIALKNDDIDTAETQFLKAIEINRENVNAYLRLAQIKRLKGEFIVAQNTYAELLALWPDFPEAHLNLAILYDVYMNESLLAQKHMEAYQFLSDGKNRQVAAWLEEIRARTGVSYSIKAGDQVSAPVPDMSVAGGVQ